jgi:hypothetical protein
MWGWAVVLDWWAVEMPGGLLEAWGNVGSVVSNTAYVLVADSYCKLL